MNFGYARVSKSDQNRELIRERIKAGIDAALEKGRKGDRPRAITPEKEAILIALY